MLAAVMAMVLAACGDNTETETSSKSNNASVASETVDESSSDAVTSSTVSVVAQESSRNPSKAPAVNSSKASGPNSSKVPDKTSSKAPATSSAATNPTGKFATIQEYLNYPEVKQQMDTLIESMKNMGLNMKITGEGSKLIYTYQYTQQVPAETADALKTSLQTQAATMEAVATSLKAAVNVSSPVVVVKYLNADGTLLLSQEFQAK